MRALASAAVAAATLLVAAGTATPSSPVRFRVLRFVDASRAVHYVDGTTSPRVLVTQVRIPPTGRGPFPLVVFCHGFALAPSTYTRLLDTWARAGYMVAAPAFPAERPTAPGGPSRTDLPNEPRDVSFVVTRLLVTMGRVVDRRRIAVGGQSDGAVAAFSVAFDPRYRDPRIDAALVMSGGPLAGFSAPPTRTPPLLAVQGTADPFNAPGVTAEYFGRMRRPKFLLWLLGASHLPPYSTDDAWAHVVDSATTAFLDEYLRGGSARRLRAAGNRSGIARLIERS